MKALVVDDSSTIRTMIKMSLTPEGFEFIEGQDGLDAMKNLGDSKVDIVITDINMPNMGGLELAKALRESENTKSTPILVITTEAGVDIKQQGKSIGVNGWLVKPFKPETLLKAVNSLIK